MNRRWVCNDVWMDILPCFDHAQLGLKLALLSPRFDALVNKHFEGKKELTLWRQIQIRKDIGMTPKLFVEGKSEGFPLPDCPLPTNIHFKDLKIEYIDHSVISFFRSNQPLFDNRGTNLHLWINFPNNPSIAAKLQVHRIWDVFVDGIWPIFAPNIRRMSFSGCEQLYCLRRRTSSTILTDLNQLNAIGSGYLLPDVFGDSDDGRNATADQMLSKWLQTPSNDGQPKRLFPRNLNPGWVDSFKEEFLRANNTSSPSSANYEIHYNVRTAPTSIEPFELVNERTNEKLTFKKEGFRNSINRWRWVLKRCPIFGGTEAVQQQQQKKKYENSFHLNNVTVFSSYNNSCIGPLFPPAEKRVKAAKRASSSDMWK